MLPPASPNPAPPLLLHMSFRWTRYLFSSSSSNYFSNTRALLLFTFQYQENLEKTRETMKSELKWVTSGSKAVDKFVFPNNRSCLVLYYSNDEAYFLIAFLSVTRLYLRFNELGLHYSLISERSRRASCEKIVSLLRYHCYFVSLQLPRLIRLRARRSQNVWPVETGELAFILTR